jgi:hypothetical protein
LAIKVYQISSLFEFVAMQEAALMEAVAPLVVAFTDARQFVPGAPNKTGMALLHSSFTGGVGNGLQAKIETHIIIGALAE